MKKLKSILPIFISCFLALVMVCGCFEDLPSNHTEHTVTIWTDDGNDETHTGQCDGCDELITLPHDWTWTKDNDGTHTATCSDCGATLTENHTVAEWTSDLNNKTHHGHCDICDEDVTGNHDWSWKKDEGGTHTGTCGDCGATLMDVHTITEWTDDKNGETHTGHCDICNEDITESHHNLKWKKDNDETHTATCEDCWATITESHTVKDGHCDICNADVAEPVNTRKAGYSFLPIITEQMPTIRIVTADGTTDFATKYDQNAKKRGEIEYVSATIKVENCDKEYELSKEAQVKVRGNGSLNYVKKAIRIKFDKKQSMLGLNEDQKFKSWVLLADWNDISMSNNTTAFYLGKTILGSDGYYSSDYRNVEVYINNEYWGVYLLAEQQEVKEGRTSVPVVEDDYTGTDIGYFFEYDSYASEEDKQDDGDPTFLVNYNNKARLTKHDGSSYNFTGGGFTTGTQSRYTVKSDIYADAQLTFLEKYVNNAYKIAYEAAYNKKFYKFNENYDLVSTTGTPQEIVSSVIDVQSLADMYILHEIAVDSDISWSSFFLSLDMTKTGSKKLIFEAPWDFDLAFGIRKGYEQNNATKLYAGNCNNPWLILFISMDWFKDIVRAKWAEILANKVPQTALSLIEQQRTTYADYYVKNFQKWSTRVTGGGEKGQIVDKVNINKTQADGAKYLTEWLTARFNLMNRFWGDGKNFL